MKFSEAWLRTWVNPPVDAAGLEHQLTMAGLEVEGREPVAADFSGVVVGEVLSVTPHPDARKLNVCQVNAGDGPLQIVCGAPNVAAGMRAPLAKVGAVLPGITLKAAQLRGVDSAGMLCSAKELGLAEDAAGLLALPAEAPVGEDLRRYLDLEDATVELSITPNRGDCLGMLGVAREVGALFRCEVQNVDCSAVSARHDQSLTVELRNPAACPRYAGRIIRNINARAPVPLWMQERLRRSGLRSISAVVDVTNYVLLELGQPMHAFDLAKLAGGIRVRNAEAGETLTLLDGQALTLDENTLVIADHQAPQALAGIMGGEASAVNDETRDIFLESAFFTPLLLAGCARRYGLQTDSSYRFERGVDFSGQVRAIERATALLVEICGGEPGPVINAEDAEHLPPLPEITLRAARIQRVLGYVPGTEEVTDYLTRLGMVVDTPTETAAGLQWTVTPPAFRFDIRREADLIEEVARIHGYDRLPQQVPQGSLPMQIPPTADVAPLRTTLVQAGYREAITYSFVDPALQAQLEPEAAVVSLQNPISSDMSVMRTTLWAGLLEALRHNQKRQQSRVRLFETGLRFRPDADSGDTPQQPMIAGVAWGTAYPEQWGETKRAVDFYDVKADVEALLARTGKPYHFAGGQHPALHPGRCAEVFLDGQSVGLLGALHPAIAGQLEIPGEAYLFELTSLALTGVAVARFQALSKYPSMRRDIAVVIGKTTQLDAVTGCIRREGGALLTEVGLFDVYQGEGIAADKQSLALGLTFRAADRNLTEGEIDTQVSGIVAALKTAFAAELRE